MINYEEGPELSIPDGDGVSTSGLTDGPTVPFAPGERELAAESMFEYGSRVGFRRLMRLFGERDLPVTMFACGLALERRLPAARMIDDSGHDFCCHGWRWIRHHLLSEDEEREHIRRAVESLELTLGSRPLGWHCAYSRGVNTRRLLVEEGGFLYDSDAYNDGNFLRGNFASGEDFYRFMRDGIDQLRAEGATAPRMMSIGLHMRIIGHPPRAHGLARLLDYVKSLDDVWVCRRIDIARHWIERHPFQPG